MKSLFTSLAVSLTALILPSIDAQTPPAPPPPPLFAFAAGGLISGSFLGVGVAEISSERARTLNLREEYGVEITHVDQDSPADKAGLKSGDVVQQYNGQRVEGIEQFQRLVRETPAGRTVKLEVVRNGAGQTLTATIASRKAKMYQGSKEFLAPAELSCRRFRFQTSLRSLPVGARPFWESKPNRSASNWQLISV